MEEIGVSTRGYGSAKIGFVLRSAHERSDITDTITWPMIASLLVTFRIPYEVAFFSIGKMRLFLPGIVSHEGPYQVIRQGVVGCLRHDIDRSLIPECFPHA